MGIFGNLAQARSRVRDTQDAQAAQSASHEDAVRQKVLEMALQIRGQNNSQANAEAMRKYQEARAATQDQQFKDRTATQDRQFGESQAAAAADRARQGSQFQQTLGEQHRHNLAEEAKAVAGGANGQPSEGERKAGAQLDLAQSANDVINGIDHRPGIIESAVSRIPFVGNKASQEDLQRLNQADDQLAMAYLRVTSGATVTADEIANTKKTFAKQPGDSPALALQKKIARQKMILAIKSQAGRAVPQGAPQATAPVKKGKTPEEILAEYGIQ